MEQPSFQECLDILRRCAEDSVNNYRSHRTLQTCLDRLQELIHDSQKPRLADKDETLKLVWHLREMILNHTNRDSLLDEINSHFKNNVNQTPSTD